MATTLDVHARLPAELVKTLEFVAKITERTKSNIIYKAVEDYLREQMEDYEDGELTLARESDPNRKLCSWEEIEAGLARKRNV